MRPALAVTDLRKSFGSIQAVDGVSFELAPGEAFGLLGPNGAGKTTTINMIVGALPPDAGQVVLDGGGDPSSPRTRRQIGVVPQSIALYEDLTAEENLRFFGALYGLRGSELTERVQWSMTFSGLNPRPRQRVGTFSGGMQRRLNLVCGLVHDPPVILLDEPTVGVDPQSRRLIADNILALKAEGRTILYTTHYMEEAQRLCDRVAIMDAGRIIACGTVPALLEQYGGPPVTKVEHGDLESVFLHLTGRHLRDE